MLSRSTTGIGSFQLQVQHREADKPFQSECTCISLQARFNLLDQFNYIYLGGVGGEERRVSQLIVCTCMHIVPLLHVPPPCTMKPASMLSLTKTQNFFSLLERMDNISGGCNWSLDLRRTNNNGTNLGVASNFTIRTRHAETW